MVQAKGCYGFLVRSPSTQPALKLRRASKLRVRLSFQSAQKKICQWLLWGLPTFYKLINIGKNLNGELPLGGQGGSESLSKSRPVASTEILGFGGHYCTSFCLFLGYSESLLRLGPPLACIQGYEPVVAAGTKRSDANFTPWYSYFVF